MPKKIFSLPREAAVSSRFRRARISSGSGRSASLIRPIYAFDAIRSKVEDYVGDKGKLTFIAAIIVRWYVVRVIESQFGTNGDEFVRPISKPDRMLRVLRGK